ncbi:MAG TPA: hypothetical protein VNE62_00240 [Actinomycetota bacterium]|nr:hypothetical protein [Actinomycetota bacterium]
MHNSLSSRSWFSGGSWQAWIQTFRGPLTASGVFGVVLLAASVLAPGRASDVPARPEAPAASAQPATNTCTACGVGYTCDSKSGQCVLLKPRRPDCVDGSRYDIKEGFCVPSGGQRPLGNPAPQRPGPVAAVARATVSPTVTPESSPEDRSPHPTSTRAPAQTPPDDDHEQEQGQTGD